MIKTSKKTKLSKPHSNHMGGTSFLISNPLITLRAMAASSFFGEPSYYDKNPPQKELPCLAHLQSQLGPEVVNHTVNSTLSDLPLEQAIDKALDFDIEATLQIATALRTEDFIRVTPQVILVRAAHHPASKGSGIIKAYASKILKRADEPAVGLAYHFAKYEGKPLPNSLKKAWKAFLEKQSEYSLAKYKKGYKTKTLQDVVNLCHAKSEAIDKLMKNNLSLNESTWESLISAKGSTKEAWAQATKEFFLKPQGHMALLRNLRNLANHNLISKEVIAALIQGAEEGQQLPFRYWSAYKAIESANEVGSLPLMSALDQCLELSLKKIPHFKGKVMSLCDNSGSAQGTASSELGTVKVNVIANLSAILTAKASDEGYIGIFGDKLKEIKISKYASVLSQLKEVNSKAETIGSSTENGVWLFWKKAIADKVHWDHIFVYSDMQAGHGGLYGKDPEQYSNFQWPDNPRMIDVSALIAEYRAKVNPNVMVYLVQVAGYTDTILPELYDKTVILGGWGPGVLGYAARLAQLQSS